jgi:hypothetical protein
MKEKRKMLGERFSDKKINDVKCGIFIFVCPFWEREMGKYGIIRREQKEINFYLVSFQ